MEIYSRVTNPGKPEYDHRFVLIDWFCGEARDLWTAFNGVKNETHSRPHIIHTIREEWPHDLHVWFTVSVCL